MRVFNGHEYDIVHLRPSQIKFAAYQRRTNVRRAMRIDKKFNGDVYNEPKVSYRDGCYWCYDGQHTVMGWQSKFGDKPMPCKVFRGMTYAEEAELFAYQSGEKDGTKGVLLPLDRFHSEKEAGNLHVMNIIAGAEAAGYNIPRTLTKGPNNIVAISALEYAYDNLGMKGYSEMIQTIRNAWPDDETAVNGNIISGMALFFKTYYGEFKPADLVKSLHKPGATPLDIINYAKVIGSGDKKFIARALLAKYNVNRRSNRLPDKI